MKQTSERFAFKGNNRRIDGLCVLWRSLAHGRACTQARHCFPKMHARTCGFDFVCFHAASADRCGARVGPGRAWTDLGRLRLRVLPRNIASRRAGFGAKAGRSAEGATCAHLFCRNAAPIPANLGANPTPPSGDSDCGLDGIRCLCEAREGGCGLRCVPQAYSTTWRTPRVCASFVPEQRFTGPIFGCATHGARLHGRLGQSGAKVCPRIGNVRSRLARLGRDLRWEQLVKEV